MSENESEPLTAKREVPQPQESPIFYVNLVHVTAGPWDVQIRFGHNVVTEEGTLQKWDAHTIHSPTHAKAFLRILAQQLMNFERTYGQIPDILAAVEAEETRAQDAVADSGPSPSSIEPEQPAEQSPTAPPAKASRLAPSRPSSRPASRAKRRPS